MSEKVKELKKVEETKGASEIDSSTSFTQEQALNVLVQGIKLATKRGAFEIEETEFLLQAIKTFSPKK